MPMKGIIAFESVLPSEKKKHQFHLSEFGESKIQRHNSTSERDPNKWVVKTEDLQMHHRPKSTKPNFFRRYVLAKAKSAATGMAIHSNERMYIVDSGASLHMMGLSSRNHREKKTIRHSSNKSGFSDRQWHCGLRHTREGLHQWTWRFSMDTCGERFSVSAIVGKTMQLTWLFFVADRRNSLTFVSMVAVLKQKAVPSIEFSTAKGHLDREQEVRTPCWICCNHLQKDWKNEMLTPQPRQLGVTLRMKLSQNNLVMRNCPWLPPTWWETVWQKIPRVRKVSSVSTREEITKCHSLSERSQFVRFVRSRKQQKHDPTVEENQRSAWMGLFLLENSETWSRQITKFWMWKTSRDADAKTL